MAAAGAALWPPCGRPPPPAPALQAAPLPSLLLPWQVTRFGAADDEVLDLWGISANRAWAHMTVKSPSGSGYDRALFYFNGQSWVKKVRLG